MKKGKIDNQTLERLVLGRIGMSRQEVLVGSGIGQDCAVLDFGEYECVLSTDPITASASRIGTLAVHISCNDVASNGVEPMAIMLTLLLPPSVTEDEIENISRQADEAAKELGIQIIGGHTEVTDIVTQPLVSATAIGRAAKGASFGMGLDKDPVPGDLIIVTKALALEGTAIAAEKCEKILHAYLTDDEFEQTNAMFDQISVVREGVIAGRIGVKAMHDITEGGVLGAVWEVCACAGIGAEINSSLLPFDPLTMRICAVLGLNPMRLLSSGSMLMIVSPENWIILSAALSEAGIYASPIGMVCDRADGIALVMKDGEKESVDPPGADEIYKL